MSKISKSIWQKIDTIITEQNAIIFERYEIIRGFWVTRVANQNMVVIGPPGTGKTFWAENSQDRIVGGRSFRTQLHPTTDPSHVFGGTDVKTLAETGVTSVLTAGMLPEATDAFLDEIMNANGPVKQSLHSIMNEGIFHNGPVVMKCPIRSIIAGTNANNCDTDPELTPFFDRLHQRYDAGYLHSRDNLGAMVTQAVARMALKRDRSSTSVGDIGATVTLEELDIATAEAFNLDVDDAVLEAFLDLKDELQGSGILFSDRRVNEGAFAVLANAWVRGHETVQIGDLDILAAMWWSLQEHADDARSIVLARVNPSEKLALDLLDELDKIKAELAAAADAGTDDDVLRRLATQATLNTGRLVADAEAEITKANANGGSTARLNELVFKAETFKHEVGKTYFGLDASRLARLQNA